MGRQHTANEGQDFSSTTITTDITAEKPALR